MGPSSWNPTHCFQVSNCSKIPKPETSPHIAVSGENERIFIQKLRKGQEILTKLEEGKKGSELEP